MAKSWAACHDQGIVFAPLAAESLGAWHSVAAAEVVKLGKALARHTCEEEHTAIQQLFQRLSVALEMQHRLTTGCQILGMLGRTRNVHIIASID